MTVAHRAAVCGKPIAHSLSPVLHTAGFAAAGLLGWTYGAIECAEADLAALVAGLGPEWAGLSLTMPLKETALTVAAAASPVARAVGAANTLVRRDDGTWFADNTDVPGMVRVLTDAGLVLPGASPAPTGGPAPAGGSMSSAGPASTGGPPAITVLGGGGTARAALAAAAAVGAAEVTVVARRAAALDDLAPVADTLGLTLVGAPWADAAAACTAGTVISTVPKGAADHLAGVVSWRPGTLLFDAVYDPWPTPLAAAAAGHGVRIVSGLDLLLAQALRQFEHFTGTVPAPEAAMREALRAAARLR